MIIIMRCVNCGVATQRLRRHITSSLPISLLNILERWLTNEVPMDTNICHPCYELLNSDVAGDVRLFGHTVLCINCGRSVRSLQRHAVQRNNSMLQALPRSHPAFHQVMNYSCHPCWMRHERLLNQDRNHVNVLEPEPEYDPLAEAEINLPNYKQTANTSTHSVFIEPKPEPEYEPAPAPAPRPVAEAEINLPNYKQTANTSTHCVFIEPKPEPEYEPAPAPRPVAEAEINLPNYKRAANTSTHCVFIEPKPEPEYEPAPAPAPRPVAEAEINLPNYKRAANTSTHCVFNGCDFGRQLHVIPGCTKRMLIVKHNFYIPRSTRVCETHLSLNVWHILLQNTNVYSNFTANQIEDIISIAKSDKPIFYI